MLIQPFSLLIHPRVAADSVSEADLVEQYEHNSRTRELVREVNQLVARVRAGQETLHNAPKADAVKSRALEAIAARLLTEPVRYGKPGLQAHVGYVAGMTAGVDQKVWRDALERYEALRTEYEALRADADRILGPR